MSFSVRSSCLLASLAASLLLLSQSTPVGATEESMGSGGMQEMLARQEEMIASQQKALEEQKERLASQEAALRSQQEELSRLSRRLTADAEPAPLPKKNAKGVKVAAAAQAAREVEPTMTDGAGIVQVAATDAKGRKSASKSQPNVAQDVRMGAPGTAIAPPPAKEVEVRPQIDMLADYGGVLTPKGMLVYENSLDYTNTTTSIFAFDGIQVADVVFIGTPTAITARRQIVQDASRFRLGLMNRLEADLRVPVVYRNDAATVTPGGGSATHTTLEGKGLGDIDFGLAYQINRGREGWPFLVGNLRFKANNGDGPFDVPYDSQNVAKELPIGTGFNSIDASLTAIKVSDPAVLFANIGYVHSIGRRIDKTFNSTKVLDVDPGAVFNGSLGMGFSINQETSFTLGYKQSFVLPTYQTAVPVNGSGVVTGPKSKSHSDTQSLGALLVGLSYRLTPRVSLNFNADVGATRDAPDVRAGFRIPVQIGKLF